MKTLRLTAKTTIRATVDVKNAGAWSGPTQSRVPQMWFVRRNVTLSQGQALDGIVHVDGIIDDASGEKIASAQDLPSDAVFYCLETVR
jgi:hypothetical protein